MKAEIRNPRAEGNPKSEIGNLKSEISEPQVLLVEDGPDFRLARMCAATCLDSYRIATIESAQAHCLELGGKWPVADGTEITLLAFRGTCCMREWLIDARVKRAELGYGAVHRGFWGSMQSIFDQVVRLDQSWSPRPVVVTGHSKGAAEALLVALLLARMGRKVAGVYTFGGPRVGDSRLRTTYDSTSANLGGKTLGEITWRFVNQEDIVPRVPSWIHGYRHAGTEVFRSSVSGMRVRPSLWSKIISDLGGTMWDLHLRRVAQVVDHPVSRYVEWLDRI